MYALYVAEIQVEQPCQEGVMPGRLEYRARRIPALLLTVRFEVDGLRRPTLAGASEATSDLCGSMANIRYRAPEQLLGARPHGQP